MVADKEIVMAAADMLAAVEAAINARLAGGAVQSYSVEGHNLQYVSLTELYTLRTKLKGEVAAETGTRNYVAFRRAG